MEATRALAEAVTEVGLQQLKPKQIEAINAFIRGRDTFVTLPTGYGKSIIYALLPKVYDKLRGYGGSIVVCISPLASIMIDQQEKFLSRGIASEFVGEAQEDAEVVRRVLKGELQLLFISPESLINNVKYRSMLLTPQYKRSLVALVIDEAHCVKTWGDEFRVAFSQIGELRSIIPKNVNILALTATTTPEGLKIISDRLSLVEPVIVGLSPNQPNIKYYVEPLPSMMMLCETLAEGVQAKRTRFSKTLIFCSTIADCVSFYQTMKSKLGRDFTEPSGYPDYHCFRLIDLYTRASSIAMKKKVIASFVTTNSKLRMVIATAAFSMGIDCPDIRNVIHFGPPAQLEQYVQETGRAGRDGMPSTALLLYGNPRKHTQHKMLEYCNNSVACRRATLFKHFLFYKEDDTIVSKCKCCDICALNCNCDECLANHA